MTKQRPKSFDRTTHGMSNTKFHNVWARMKCRCNQPSNSDYPYYGGRGIKVCERWLESFENFRDDMLATYKEGLQLDRKDNNGPYSPDNCRWATRSQNQKNRRGRADVQSDVDHVTYNKTFDLWQVKLVFSFKTQEEAEKFAANCKVVNVS